MGDESREMLKSIQHKAQETNTSVGKQPTKNLKDFFQSRNNDSKKKKSKGTQVNVGSILAEDLSGSTPSDKYWEALAEKRRNALQEALEENKLLWTKNNELIKENAEYSKKLDEALSFVDVVKELINETNNDTGIDVRDVSQEVEG